MNNILVMLLSTFNTEKDGTVKRSIAYDEVNNEFEYYHQMEPVPQMLRKRGELDTIVALCTDETFKERELIIADEEKEISAVGYFKDVFKDVQVNVVKIDKNNPSGGIINAIEIIRNLYKSEDQCRLWIDIHGGLRALQITFQVIISLLEKEGIKSEKNYTISKKDEQYFIHEEEQSFDINYLFAGMNEFFNSGKADMLEKFIKRQPDNSNNNRLIEIVNKISDSILLCDVDSFDSGCDEMQDWLDARENDGSYIDIFAEYFKADYGKLLTKKKGITPRIEWCCDKEYLQQALTIIESKMPDKIYNSFILCTNANDVVEVQYKNNTVKKTINDLIDETKQKWEHRSNFLVMKYAYNRIMDKDSNANPIYLDLSQDLDVIAESVIKTSLPEEGLETRFEMEGKNRHKYEVVFEYRKEKQTESIFKLFMQLHMTLKNQRNSAAHGASSQKAERVKAYEIKRAIRVYLKLARELGIN